MDGMSVHIIIITGNTGSSGSEQLQVSLDCNTVEWTVQHQDTATTTEHCRIYYYQVSVHAADGYGHGGATAAAGDSVSVYLLNSSATSGSIMLDLTPGARYLLVVSPAGREKIKITNRRM